MATQAKTRLAAAPLYAVVPATDIPRARRFYAETLGLEVDDRPDAGGFMVQAGGGSSMLVYETGASAGTATQAAFQVDDLYAVVADLREHGITFEEYDLPGLKTVDGIAEAGSMKTAWFKDSEGNIIAVSQTP